MFLVLERIWPESSTIQAYPYRSPLQVWSVLKFKLLNKCYQQNVQQHEKYNEKTNDIKAMAVYTIDNCLSVFIKKIVRYNRYEVNIRKSTTINNISVKILYKRS